MIENSQGRTVFVQRLSWRLLVRVLLGCLLCASAIAGLPLLYPSAPNRDVTQQRDTTVLTQRIDQLVQDKVRELNIPGYSLVVIHHGKTLIQKGYGYADKEALVPATPQTVFGLASVTKTFTALALLQLVDDGKVNLDNTLDKYYSGLSPEYQRVTLRQLATMSAGVPKEGIGDNKGLSWQQEFLDVQQRPLEFIPGTKFRYANLSYRILGGVIERASGKPYMAFLKQRVLDPLGMNQTMPTDGTFAQPMAVPYNENGKPLGGYKQPSTNFASGMLASNAIDMAKYAQALLDQKLLSPAGYQNLWKTHQGLPDVEKARPSPWAFGWGTGTTNGHFHVGMNGGLPGVASSILICPDDQLIIIGLANVQGSPHKIAPLVAKEVLGVGVGEVE